MRSENAVTQQSTTDPCTDWRPLATCCLGTFLLLAYTTVVTVSAPVIAESVGSGFAVSQWIIDVYTLALAALVLAMGSLGDRIGHRQLFLIGLAGLGTASVACAAATTGGMLIAARGAQGIGGAAVFATVVPLLTQCYDGRARGIAFAVWGAVAGAGSTVGTVAGGAVTEFVTWRWLFVAAVPICAVAVTIGAISLPRERPARTRVDVAGTALLTTAMTGTTFAVINGGEHGWTTAGTLGGIAVAAASVLFLIPAPRRAAPPGLPPPLFATHRLLAV
ncbi:MFS transporter, partial [Mycolicibacterium setense]|uniref:MFS transporter n=1 Tax=Mycolicibacterium setense TaxID=431269 RepID=UPI001955106B